VTARALLYLDAARHMRTRQIAGRARRLVSPAVLAAGAGSRRAPSWRPNAGGVGVDRAPQSGPTAPPEEGGEFSAFGISRRFDAAGFWDDPGDGQLFLIHLHGFSPLASYAAGPRSPSADAFWAAVIESWLSAEQRPRLPSWHPYPTSVRILSWAAALSTIDSWPHSLRSRVAAELWRQARYLRRSIEQDIGGNHVIKNATALIGAGAIFPDSGLLDSGLGVLSRELGRQILSDGGHEERSTSYHRQVRHDLEDARRLVRAAGGSVPEWLDDTVARCDDWEAEMAGPGGMVPLLNDAWEIPAASERRSAPVTHLEGTGHVVLRDADDQVIFDVGPICPPHLPPHAHADVLSFVVWAEGEPLLVDPGAYAYTGEPRNVFRGTAAHNTVEVDGSDQCEFWGDFRAARQPRVHAGRLRREDGVVVAAGSHDGYRRLEEPVTHHRTLIWCPGDGLVAVDLLRGRGDHAIRSSLHVAPGAPLRGVERLGAFDVAALGPGACVTREGGEYSPSLGRKVPAAVLVDRRRIGPEIPFGWSLLRGNAAVSALERDRVVIARGDGSSVSVSLDWS
jgi:hypothetical protein